MECGRRSQLHPFKLMWVLVGVEKEMLGKSFGIIVLSLPKVL
jgi:hypothetical protein